MIVMSFTSKKIIIRYVKQNKNYVTERIKAYEFFLLKHIDSASDPP